MKRIIGVIAVLCFIILNPTAAFTQGRWETGYLILNSGDTLRGLIKDKSDVNNSQSVSYAVDKKATPAVYTPQNVKEYYIESTDRWYSSFQLPSDSTGKTRIFLQQLIAGDASYYYLKDSMGSQRFFMKMTSDKLRELRIIVTDININDLTNKPEGTGATSSAYFRQTDKQYLGMMRSGFAKCNALVMDSTFDNTAFSLRPMGKKFIAYNKCVSPAGKMYVASKVKDRGAIELMVSAGPSFSHAIGPKISSTDHVSNEYNVMRGAKTHYGYSVGIASNFFLPVFYKAISIQIGVDFADKSAYSPVSNVTFNLHYLDGSVLLKYNYPFGIVRPFIGLGMVAGYSLKGKSSYYHDVNGTRTYLNHDGYGAYEGFDAFSEVGLSGELGLKVALKNHRLLCYAKYDYTVIPFTHALQKYSNSCFQARIGYAYYFKLKPKI